MPFRDRMQAAEMLAEKLRRFKDRKPLVLGIPRGSVPMARRLAELLHGDLDVVLVHKIGAPGNPEYAIGSVSELGSIYRTQAVEFYELSSQDLQRIADAEIRKLKRRRETYSPIRPPIPAQGRTVIIVDDGIATGSTMLAAIRALRSQKAARIIAAAPVASPRAIEDLGREADEVVVVEAPEDFFAISEFYESFPQVSDEEVYRTLSEAAAAKPPKAA